MQQAGKALKTDNLLQKKGLVLCWVTLRCRLILIGSIKSDRESLDMYIAEKKDERQQLVFQRRGSQGPPISTLSLEMKETKSVFFDLTYQYNRLSLSHTVLLSLFFTLYIISEITH